MGQLVFLGGTCGENDWRKSFIEELISRGVDVDTLFDPVVPGSWTHEDQVAEDEAKDKAAFMVYYLADPMQEGNPVSVYSLVEATMALYDDAERTVVVFDNEGMEGHSLKAMQKAERDLRKRFPDANILATRADAIEWLANRLS